MCDFPRGLCDEGFLVTVYRLRQRRMSWVSTDALAETCGVSEISVVDQAWDLARAGMVDYSECGVALTDAGLRVAKQTHRYRVFVRFGQVLDQYQRGRSSFPPAWALPEHDRCRLID